MSKEYFLFFKTDEFDWTMDENDILKGSTFKEFKGNYTDDDIIIIADRIWESKKNHVSGKVTKIVYVMRNKCKMIKSMKTLKEYGYIAKYNQKI